MTIKAIALLSVIFLSNYCEAQTVVSKVVDSAGHFKSREVTSTSRHGDTVIVTKSEADSSGKITSTTTTYTLQRADTMSLGSSVAIGFMSPFFIDLNYGHAISYGVALGGGVLLSPLGSYGVYLNAGYNLDRSASRFHFGLEPMIGYIAARESIDTIIGKGSLEHGTFAFVDSTVKANGDVFILGMSLAISWLPWDNIAFEFDVGGSYGFYTGTEGSNPRFLVHYLNGFQPLGELSVGYGW